MSEDLNSNFDIYDMYSSIGSLFSQYLYDQNELLSTPLGNEQAPNLASQREEIAL